MADKEARKRNRVDRRVEEFRARVLEAAATLFATQGIEATKLDEICATADVAKRTLSNHFPTKGHIVQALSVEAVSLLVALIDDTRIAGDSTADRLTRLFAKLRQLARASGPLHPELLGAYFQAGHGSDATESELRLSDAMLRLVRAGKRNELPRGVSPETFGEVVVGILYSTTLEWIHRDGYDMDLHLANAAKFLVGALPGR